MSPDPLWCSRSGQEFLTETSEGRLRGGDTFEGLSTGVRRATGRGDGGRRSHEGDRREERDRKVPLLGLRRVVSVS